MNFTPAPRSEETFDLTPLIDVVFLLLIFFMVSTTFIREPGGLRVDLPHSDTQEFIREGDELVIKISVDGEVFLDEVRMDDDALKGELHRTVRKDPETTIIIKADKNVEHGRVVQVMDIAKRIGLHRLAVATEGSRLRSAATDPASNP